MSERIECPFSAQELQDFFLEVMTNHSWASGVKATPCEGVLSGYVEIIKGNGRLILLDRWCSNQFGQCSSGTTTISVFCDDVWQPVWVMDYRGWYEKEASRFVKQALLNAYKQGTFNGGRGLAVDDSSPPMKYLNTVIPGSTFEKFAGFETVNTINVFADYERPCLGWHKYSGMLLLGKPRHLLVR